MTNVISILKRKSASGKLFCQANFQTGIMSKETKELSTFSFQNNMVTIVSVTNPKHKKILTENEFKNSIFDSTTVILSAFEASEISVESRIRLVRQNRPVREGDYALAPNGLVAKLGEIKFGYPYVKKYQDKDSDFPVGEWKPVKFVVTTTGEPDINSKYLYDTTTKRVVNIDAEQDRDWFERNKANLEQIAILSNEFPMELRREITSGHLKDGDIINR